LLDGYRLRRHEPYLQAARRAGDFLVATQLAHGGWFSELPAAGSTTPWWFRLVADTRAMLDDDVTPGAVRFLVALWQATGDARYRAAAERGIALMRAAQLPSGAWPLDARPSWLRRLHPHYEDQPALNDGATPFAITTLLAVAPALGRRDLVGDAARAGDWLLAVQGRAPRAGWAQQYTPDGEPAAARRFEVPALASWETRHAIDALVALASATGDRRYCDGALAAARWLADVRVGPSCWARFYDVGDGTPVFADADGRRVRSSLEARPAYSWMGEFGIPSSLARLGIGHGASPPRLPGDPGRCPEDPSPPRPLAGARAMTAEAAIVLAGAVPPAPSPCGRF
jgi:hypothetical protein